MPALPRVSALLTLLTWLTLLNSSNGEDDCVDCPEYVELTAADEGSIISNKITASMSALVTLLTWLALLNSSNGEDECVHCPEYVEATASDKEEIIFNKITATEYPPGQLPPWQEICDLLTLSEGIDFNNMFDRFSDERPANFQRFFHINSIVGKVKFVSTMNHSFTGLFKGANHGVLRFSPLFPLLSEEYLIRHFTGTFSFSFGLKLFRDGMYSGNILTGETRKGIRGFSASHATFSQPDFNIFSRPVDNMPGIGGTTGMAFEEFEKFSGVVSAADVAAYDEQGIQEESPVTPIVVHFRPNADLATKFGKGPSFDFRTWTTTEEAIPTGTAIYSVWTTINSVNGTPSLCVDENGWPQVDDDVIVLCPEQSVIKLGDVITKSRFYSSEWVDKSLMFQHTRMCPKDQSTCVMNDPSNPPALTIPAPTYAINNTKICVSDDDKDGIIDGMNPSCPVLSSLLSGGSCFPGSENTVEDTQIKQCPFMDQVASDIVNAPPSDRPDLCFPIARFGINFVLEPILNVVAWVLQTFRIV